MPTLTYFKDVVQAIVDHSSTATEDDIIARLAGVATVSGVLFTTSSGIDREVIGVEGIVAENVSSDVTDIPYIPEEESGEFPYMGIILVDTEKIQYNDLDYFSTEEDGTLYDNMVECERGYDGTSPAAHTSDTVFQVISVSGTSTKKWVVNAIELGDEAAIAAWRAEFYVEAYDHAQTAVGKIKVNDDYYLHQTSSGIVDLYDLVDGSIDSDGVSYTLSGVEQTIKLEYPVDFQTRRVSIYMQDTVDVYISTSTNNSDWTWWATDGTHDISAAGMLTEQESATTASDNFWSLTEGRNTAMFPTKSTGKYCRVHTTAQNGEVTFWQIDFQSLSIATAVQSIGVSGEEYMKIDSTGGIQISSAKTNAIRIKSGGNVILEAGGTIRTAESGARTVLGADGLAIYDETTQRAEIGSDGAGWFGASDKIAWTSDGVLTVGGFTIGATTIVGTNLTLDSSGQRITLGSGNDIIILDADDGTYRLWMGHATAASAPFSVTKAGVLKSTSGEIGGFTIGATTLTATNLILDSSGQRITLGSGSNIITLDADDGTYRIWVGHATAASAPFSVSKAGAMLAESGTIGGFTIASTKLSSANIEIDSGNNRIVSTNYVSGFAGAGFLLSPNLFEVGNIACRGIFRTVVFQKDIVSIVGGNLLVLAGDVLDVDMSALDASTLTIAGNETFSVGDLLRIKDGTDDEWLEVTNIGSAPTYTVTRDKSGNYDADDNPAWKEGASVADYKTSGEGGVYMTASESNAPYLSVFTHAGSPWSDITTHMRLGNLNGYLGYSSDKYGIAIGEAANYLKYDPTNGLRLRGTIIIESGSSGLINIGGDLDDIDDGDDYGKVNLTAISAGKIVLTSLGVSGSLPTSLSDADITADNVAASISGQGNLATQDRNDLSYTDGADNTVANETFSSEGDMELDDITGTNKATILQTVVDAGYVKLLRLAADSTERLEITAGGVKGYANNVKNFELASGIAYLGDQANEHIKLSSSGLQIKDGGTVYATYGATTTIGRTGSGQSNVYITGGALSLRNNVTNIITLSSAGVVGITVKNGGNVTLEAGGDIILNPSDSNPALIKWPTRNINLGCAATQNRGLCIWPNTTNTEYFKVGYDPVGNAEKPFYTISLDAYRALYLRTKYDAPNWTLIQCVADSGDTSITLFTNETGGAASAKFSRDGLEVDTNGTIFSAVFWNDGNDTARKGIKVAAGTDNGLGNNYFFEAAEGDGYPAGGLRTLAGDFQLYQISSRELKQNIKDTQLQGLSSIMSIKVRDFEFKRCPDNKLTGFIAEELLEALPKVVADCGDGLLGISRDAMVPAIVKAIQEQQSQIETLEDEIELLKTT